MTGELRDDSRPFRVLATCGVFEPGFRGGGPARSVARIVDTVTEHIDLVLVTSDRDLGSSVPYPGLSGRWIPRNHARVFYLNAQMPRQWLRLWRQLRTAPFDLLYVNSLWAPVYTIVPIIAVRLGLIRAGRVAVAPRGELSPGALSLKARKKVLFFKLWGPFLKSMNVVWHATAEREASDIRSMCPWARVEVNPNQVSLPEQPIPPAAINEGPVRLVFVGRISRMKNLDLALGSLLNLSRSVEFDIYGPLEDAQYWSRCQALVSKLPAFVRVRYQGELEPAKVRQTFSRYDAFVFPTLGENFGHVIAESLSASCPVICSQETPWTDVLEAGGGVVVRELTSANLLEELDRIAAMAPAERLRMRYLAGEAYRSWRLRIHGPNILEQARLARW